MLDRTSPNRTSLDRTSPNKTSPDRTSLNRTSPDKTLPNRTSPDRTLLLTYDRTTSIGFRSIESHDSTSIGFSRFGHDRTTIVPR